MGKHKKTDKGSKSSRPEPLKPASPSRARFIRPATSSSLCLTKYPYPFKRANQSPASW
jgi:hypothetical protein